MLANGQIRAQKLLLMWGNWLMGVRRPGPAGYPSSDMLFRSVFGGRQTIDADDTELLRDLDRMIARLPNQHKKIIKAYYADPQAPSYRDLGARWSKHWTTVQYHLDKAIRYFWAAWQRFLSKK